MDSEKITKIAQETMESVRSYLLSAPAGRAPNSGSANGQLWFWLKGRLNHSAAQEDLIAVEQNPYNQIRIQMVAVHLQELLESDPAALQQLAAMLAPPPFESGPDGQSGQG